MVFTKFDQFLRNVEMHLVDYPDEFPADSKVSEIAEEQFQEHYLRPLGKRATFVRLESEFGVKYRGYLMLYGLRQKCISQVALALIFSRRRRQRYMRIESD